MILIYFYVLIFLKSIFGQKKEYIDDDVLKRIQSSIDKGVQNGNADLDDETLEDINKMLGIDFANAKEVEDDNAIIQSENGVYILNETNFDEFVMNNTYVLIEFYAPWCGHCNTLAPLYERAAQHFKNHDPPIKLAKIDGPKNEELMLRFEVTSYPTLKFFLKENEIDYQGNTQSYQYQFGLFKLIICIKNHAYQQHETKQYIISDINALIKWASNFTKIQSTQVDWHTDLGSLINKEDHAMLYLGLKFFIKQGKQIVMILNIFIQLVKLKNEFPLCILRLNNQWKNFKFQIILQYCSNRQKNLFLIEKTHNNYNENIGQASHYVFDKEFDLDNILNFYKIHALDRVNKFDQTVADFVYGENIPAVILILQRKFENLRKIIEELMLAEEQLQKSKLDIVFSVAYMDSDDKVGQRLGDYIGLKEKDLPIIVIVNPSDNEILNYRMEQEITSNNIQNFVNQFFNNELNPFFLSEDVDENQTSYIKKIVGKNFNQMVFNQQLNVCVIFYAQGSQISQKLIDDLEKDNQLIPDNTKVYKFDAVNNEIRGISIQDFPTVIYYPQFDKSKFFNYKGHLVGSKVMDFLQKHGGNSDYYNEVQRREQQLNQELEMENQQKYQSEQIEKIEL